MLDCPNKSHPVYKHLYDNVGDIGADRIFAANGRTLPKDINEANIFIEQYKAREKAKDFEEKTKSVENIIEALQATSDQIKKIGENIYYTDSEKRLRRISEKIDKWQRINGNAYRGKDDRFYAHKGVILHAYFEEILKSFDDKKKPAWKAIEKKVYDKLKDHSELKEYEKSFYALKQDQFNDIVKGIGELYDSFRYLQNKIDPKKQFKLMLEQPIFNKATDETGTIDVLVLFSDGSSAIYDFKNKVKKGKKAHFGLDTKIKWDVQISNYASMLKHNYGVSHVRQARVVPVEVNYMDDGNTRINAGFQSLSVYNKESNLDHLKPIPFERETGNVKLDLLLKKLYEQRAQVIAKRKFEKVTNKKIAFTRKANELTKSIEEILQSSNVNTLLNSLRQTWKEYHNDLNKPENEGGKTLEELHDTYHELEIFKTISTDLIDEIKKLPKDTQHVAKERLQKAQITMDQLKDDIMQAMIIRIDTDADRIGNIGQGISRIGSFFNGLDNYQIEIFQHFNKIYSTADEAARIQTESQINEFNKSQKILEEWASSKGLSLQQAYEKMYDVKKGSFHSKYTDEFWGRYNSIKKEARATGQISNDDIKFFNRNFEIDQEAFNKYKKEFLKDLDKQLKAGIIDEQTKLERIEKFNKFTNPNVKNNFYKGNTGKDRLFVKPRSDVEEKYLSKEFKYIEANPKLKQYYDLYQNTIQEYRDLYGMDVINYDFVPNVQADLTTMVAERKISGMGDWWRMFKYKFKVKEEDEIGGITSKDLEGNEVKTIPLLYVENILTSLSNTERTEIEKQVENEIKGEVEALEPRNSAEFTKKVEERIRKKQYEKGLAIKSRDIHRSMILFMSQANQHLQMSAIETETQVLQTIANSDIMSGFKDDATAYKAFDEIKGKMYDMTGIPEDVKGALSTFIDRLIYRKKYKNDKIIKGYSVNKVTQHLMSMFSNMVIGANIVLIGSNYATAVNNMAMMGSEGNYFNKKAWRKSFKLFGMRDEKFKNATEFIQNVSRDYISEAANRSGVNFVSKLFRNENLYWGHIKTDEAVDRAISVTMAEQWVLDSDGVIKNPEAVGSKNKIINKDAPKLIDLIKRDEKGMTYVEGLSMQEFASFRNKVRKVSQRIKGMTNEKQKGMVYSSMLTASFMHLRSWITGMATTRFGRVEYDTVLDNMEAGRFRIAVGHIAHDGALPAIKNLGKLLGQAASFGIYKANRQEGLGKLNEYGKLSYQRFIRENPSVTHVTEADYAKLIHNKIQSAAMEVRLYLAFFLLVSAIGGFEFDEEDNAEIVGWNAQQILRRSLLELSFWMSPNSAIEIIRSPLPLISLVTRVTTLLEKSVVSSIHYGMGVENPNEKTTPIYHILRMVPGVNQILDLFGYFEKYNRPKTTMEKIFFEED